MADLDELRDDALLQDQSLESGADALPEVDIASPSNDEPALHSLALAQHGDPFSILGLRDRTITTVQCGAKSVEAIAPDGRRLAVLQQVHAAGIFSGQLTKPTPYRLRIQWPGGDAQVIDDPYSFAPLLSDEDLQLLSEGRHPELAATLGAHVSTVEGVIGTRFAVWAPNARRVSVVGEFNGWDGRRHPMRLRHHAGVWELFIPQVHAGTLYKYEVLGADGSVQQKSDPLARHTEKPPATASLVPDPRPFHWTDGEWIAQRRERDHLTQPMSAYEVHSGSWLRILEDGSRSLDWNELADRLIPYVKELGFTHIELMPINEHPFYGSWGYQPLGLFAPTARHGRPEEFAGFVDRCHAAGIGVLLDWVPAHFPTDAHGLARFDGTALYEHGNPQEGFHHDWNTLIYNLGRHEVRNFLMASALEWIERYHVDGLRVDAVASMLYRDYSRKHGEWVPNVHGGRENLEAISFFRELSQLLEQRNPGALLIAEESTAFPLVSSPVEEGGLGFHYKWNMGWMHDTLHYLSREPVYRRWDHHAMTFGLVYAFSEKFVLPLSHDEVVYGKGSLIGKMPGDEWQQFANLRAYFGFMWAHPGKKLMFMGGEIAQRAEWNHDASLDWNLLDQPLHRGVQTLVRDLNRLYASEPALHARDHEPDGFTWVLSDDTDHSVYAWLRYGAAGDKPVLVVCNFTPVGRQNFRIGVPLPGVWRELLNTDAAVYGGSNQGNSGLLQADEAGRWQNQPHSLWLNLPPLSTLVLRPD